ncbi:cyanase, partial [Phytoactinopolyspora endophytica]|uniref:cyanase n=1 Tax=Phytoactinopolyspora endophytica TaxID=1642495 RepID=UPI001F0EAFEF
CEFLELDEQVAESLQLQPSRGTDPALMSDPTIYRFVEALSVYGPALKELIHEEFGDGIMSAINFRIDLSRRPDPEGDRVVVTFDGKFLDYKW